MQKIRTFLWFNDNAEEAAHFYTSIFKNSSIGEIMRCGEAGPGPVGSALVVEFTMEGQEFLAMNGGPLFPFTPAISLMVSAETQAEIDDLWAKLLEGGKESQCGWLSDKFGLSWQITPPILVKLLRDPDPAKSSAVMEAMMKMVKLDIPTLQAAYDGA